MFKDVGLLGAFGYGGTNVHMVVSAAHSESEPARTRQVWKREKPLSWVCPAFVKKDDPLFSDGLADKGSTRASASDKPVIDQLIAITEGLVNGDVKPTASLHDLGVDSLSRTRPAARADASDRARCSTRLVMTKRPVALSARLAVLNQAAGCWK
jgi:hypothetical protein